MTRRPVVVTPYQPHWVDEFTRIAKHIRDLVGPAAMRIDHIGSTAVPGLGAKDVIDIQITVSDLDAADGRTQYELVKRRASQVFPDSIDGYLFLKDPVLHIIYEVGSLWAEKVGWSPDEDYI